MPKFAATDYAITINGSSFATSLNSVELALTADDLETTAFGGEWRTRIAGLKSGSLTLNFMQDFGASSVDATDIDSETLAETKRPPTCTSV